MYLCIEKNYELLRPLWGFEPTSVPDAETLYTTPPLQFSFLMDRGTNKENKIVDNYVHTN
jgi:hypothetical protein